MILLTIRDLRHRLVRFVVVTVLGAVVFALLFVMTGLVEQFHLEPYDSVEAFGTETWIVPDGISGPFTAGSTLPLALLDQIDADAVAPVVISRSSLAADSLPEGEEVIVVGHAAGKMGTPPAKEGETASAPGEAVVDSSVGLDLGETIRLAGEPFTVVGISSNTTLLAGRPLVFIPLADAQRLVYQSEAVVSAVLASGARGVPDGFAMLSNDDVAADSLKPLEGAIATVDLVRALLWIVAAVIVGAVVYLSALERQRDFAVLKAMGAPTKGLLGSLAIQAVLVALAAVLLAAVLQVFLAPAFPLRVRLPPRALWQVPLFAAVMALVAGLAGMRRVISADPAAAFAGAGA